jgi:UDP-N-acetylglucosamine diphosphorylase / glucose-1-phosphate thymidylyltransferase / UDP-N-acetylgalactosamine diphosphorylase / glucosamine-1-phosphate N-acetyltransferase / galactosamine-1-phosphate N-acetyltransferase
MRLILFDRPSDRRIHFDPPALGRPIWELRCGMSTLGEKLVAAAGAEDVACFVPDYMAEAYRRRTERPVNDPSVLSGDDLLLVHPTLKAEALPKEEGPSRAAVDGDGGLLWARIARRDLLASRSGSIDELVAWACESLPRFDGSPPTWNYTWDLVLANAEQLRADFAAAGRHGIEGDIQQPLAVRGNQSDVYVAPGAQIHPMVVLDAEHGPIYIDEEAEIHPFTRIEGPCYIGRKTILLGAKCREGNSIGPMCRVGGEIEESILHGCSNKYHDGFLGHAYVGEWVNLGAGTSNSDLKNDYSTVEVVLDGKRPIDTGSTKVGALIGDHAKTSIGTLFNTGAYVGAMAIVAATGKPLPKFLPSFGWFLEGVVTKGFGKRKLYETARAVTARRGAEWTDADEALWDAVYAMTAPARNDAVQRGRRAMAASSGIVGSG